MKSEDQTLQEPLVLSRCGAQSIEQDDSRSFFSRTERSSFSEDDPNFNQNNNAGIATAPMSRRDLPVATKNSSSRGVTTLTKSKHNRNNNNQN